MRVPTILDVEASGFGAHSYPIEVGVARHDGEKFCRLIRPFDSWTYWDGKAQALHGISQHDLLQHGANPKEVCLQLNAFMGCSIAYSDGWVVDHPWLIKLYTAAGVDMTFQLRAIEYLLNERQMNVWTDTKTSVLAAHTLQRHRASSDAEVIQKTYVQSSAIPTGETLIAK